MTRKRTFKRKPQGRKAAARKTAVKKPALRLRKTVGTMSRSRAFVKPRRVKTEVGQMSTSITTRSSRASPQVRAIKNVADSNIYVVNLPTSLSIESGKQKCVSLATLDWSDLYYIGNSLPQSNSGLRRYVVESVLNEFTYTNQSTGGVEFEIIDLVAKRDLFNAWSFEANGRQYGPLGPTPEQVWEYGALAGANLPNAPLTDSPAFVVGSKPFDTATFNDYFTPIQRNIVMLPQGASHRHVLNLKPNRLIDEALWNQGVATTFLNNYKGMTIYTFIIARGTPVIDPTSHLATTGSGLISVVKSSRIKYCYSEDASKTILFTNQLVSSTAPAIVNVGSGQPEAERIAQ